MKARHDFEAILHRRVAEVIGTDDIITRLKSGKQLRI